MQMSKLKDCYPYYTGC